MPRILFLTAGNVHGLKQLRVGREARAVRNAITAVEPDFMDLRVEPDIGADEIVPIVLGAKPDIIHFSGHGMPGWTQLDNKLLPAETVAQIVEQVPELWCVVLNACYSSVVAERLKARGVPAVIGMKDSVSDAAAIAFSTLFYGELIRGVDVERAVNVARTHLLAAFPDEAATPELLVANPQLLETRSARHARPEVWARFCVKRDNTPDVWKASDGTVFVTFDLYIANAPDSAASVVYRLHESYNDATDDPAEGQFREVTDASHGFYLSDLDTEDDYTVEAFIRWNDGRARLLKCKVSTALSAHYDHDPEVRTSRGKVAKAIRRKIGELINGNIQVS